MFLDETAATTTMARRYGQAPRGRPALLPLLALALALPWRAPPAGLARLLLVPTVLATFLGLYEIPMAILAFYYAGG